MPSLPRSPYPLREFVPMVWRRFSAPPPLGDQPLAVDLVVDEERTPERWLGFVGDISPLADRDAVYDHEILDFFDGCDLMVGNLEGVITDDHWRPFLHNHTPRIFEALRPFAPLDRWALSVANNHALDYGEADLYHTVSVLEDHGVRWLGTRDRPRVTLYHGVTLTAWTWWVNGQTDAVPRRDPGAPATAGLHVAFPHWGYEHERVPRPEQRARVPAGYDLVVGAHSHLPQPLEQLPDGRIVAWSLGNLLTRKRLRVLGEGAILKVGVARDAGGTPAIVRLQFRLIRLDRSDPAFCRVHLRRHS